MTEQAPIARFKVGDRCKCLHPYAFRGEDPFKIVSITATPADNHVHYRLCYVVQYDNGQLDAIPIHKDGGYRIVKLRKLKVNRK